MNATEVDPALVHRLSAHPVRATGVPAQIDDARQTPAKQFLLWDVKREEAMEPTDERDRVPAPRILDDIERRPELPPFRPDATREFLGLVPASLAAHKAYKGWRALLKVAIRKPYRRDEG